MAISNEEKLKKLLYLMDEDSMTKQDFIKEWKKVLDLVRKIKDENVKAIRDMKEAHLKLSGKINDNNNQNLTKIGEDFTEKIKDLEKRYSVFMTDIELRVAEIKDGQDGKDADEEVIVDKVLNKIRIPEIDEIEKDLPKLGEPIRDALELLDGDNRLMMSAVKGLEEKLKELEEAKSGGNSVGGLINTVRYHDLSDQLDGAEKTFKVPAFRVAVQLSGTQFPIVYRPGIDFTTGNKTITLTDEVSAPEAGQSLLFLYVK
jgi:hypothetical protein